MFLCFNDAKIHTGKAKVFSPSLTTVAKFTITYDVVKTV